MTALNFDDCIGCGLCVLGCPAFEETGFDLLTARGRNKALQSGLAAADMVEPIWACTLCGYCDAICPTQVRNVEIVLHLRRELAEVRLKSDATKSLNRSSGDQESSNLLPSCSNCSASPSNVASDFSRTMTTTRPSLVLGCTIRERAPHLVPSIREFLRRIGRATDSADEGCCGSLEVEAGRAMRSRAPAGVVSDPICLEQYDAEFLGVLAMQHLEVFELKPPFYYFAPHRLVNRDHARIYPLYDALRRRVGCDMNLDLNRLARSTSAGSVQGMTGRDARDIPAAVARLLTHSKAERVITCSPADYLAFKLYSGRETLFITECLR
jgi:NAD-dependent dihydropyrimidine dehydrogenase PreA subunit